MAILSIKEILEKGDYLISFTYDKKYKVGKIYISWTKETFIIKYSNGKLTNNFTNEIITCKEEYAKGYVYLILNNICKKYNFPYKFVKFIEDQEEKDVLSYENSNEDFYYLVKDMQDDGLKPTHYELAKLHGLENQIIKVMNYYMGIPDEG